MKQSSTFVSESALPLSRLLPWLIWAFGSTFLFYKYLLQVTPSILVSYFRNTFHLSAAGMGNFAAFYFYAYMLMQFPSGLLLDRYAVRRLLPLAIVTCSLGLAFMSQKSSLALAEMGRFLIGIGGAFSALGTLKLITLYFKPSQFSLLSSLMMTVGMLGAVGGQAPLAYYLDRVGVQKGLLHCVIFGLLLAIGMHIILSLSKINEETRHCSMSIISAIKRLLRSKQCWLISLFSGLAFMPISAFSGLWGVPFLELKTGLSKVTCSALISNSLIGFALGCPISGYLTERFKRRKPLMIFGTSLGLVCLSLVIWSSVTRPSLLAGLLFFYGFFTSFFFISFTVIKEINPLRLSGAAIGFINTFDAVFGAISEPLIGYVKDQTETFEWAFIVLAVAMLMSLIFLVGVKESYQEGARPNLD